LKSGSIKLLLIEDSEDDAILTTDALSAASNYSFSVRRASSLKEGLERVNSGCAVVLTDLGLPDSQGVDTVRKLVTSNPMVPIVVLTGGDERELGLECIQAGAVDCVVKGSTSGSALARTLEFAIHRKAAEVNALHVHAVIESSADAIITVDVGGHIKGWNPAAETIFGYTAEEMVGRPKSLLYPADKITEFERIREDLNNGIAGKHIETNRLHKSGRLIDVELSYSPLRSANGTIIGGSFIARDITQQNQNSKRLLEMQEIYDLAVKSSNEGVWDWDLQTQSLRYLSKQFSQLCGYDEQEVGGDAFELWQQAVHPEDLPHVNNRLELHLEKNVPYEVEYRLRNKGGEYSWFQSRGSAWRDEHGNPWRMIGTLRDISERKKSEEQQQRLLLLEQQREFLATLTHDLKNPLLGAERIFELVLDGAFGRINEEQRQVLAGLRKSNEALIKMIQNHIELYRLEQMTYSRSPAKLNIGEFAVAICDQYKIFAVAKNVSLETDIETGLPEVNGDENALRRLISNLLDNAIKFTPPGGSITLSARVCGPEVAISVSDTGPGITEEELDLLYQRFSQCEAGKAYSDGSGLGLYVCRRIVEAHGGNISCKSTNGKGATFTITLPCAESPRFAEAHER
jgi:PAS domain S-box-containing protein